MYFKVAKESETGKVIEEYCDKYIQQINAYKELCDKYAEGWEKLHRYGHHMEEVILQGYHLKKKSTQNGDMINH